MAADFHVNLHVAAGVVSGTLTACSSTPLAVWEELCQRGVETQGVTPNCPITRTLSSSYAGLASLALSFLLSAIFVADCLSLHTHARTRISLPFLFSLAAFFLPPPLRLRPFRLRLRLRPSLPLCLLLFFVVPLSSFFFFTSASSSCFSSSSSSPLPPLVLQSADPCWLKPLWLQAQLLGGVHVGSQTEDLSSDVALC